MTDRPYTDADLRAEAARQHHMLTQDPDFMGVGEAMETIASTGESWEDALVNDEDDWTTFDAAQNAIHDLINGAADVSEWAITLGAAGLEPGPTYAWINAVPPASHDVAIHIATNPQITDAKREELHREIHAAVAAVVHRVLMCKPVEAAS